MTKLGDEKNERFAVEIDGEYGVTDGSIHLLIDGREVVMWDSAEWAEDPSLTYVIAEAIRRGYDDPDALASSLSSATTTEGDGDGHA